MTYKEGQDMANREAPQMSSFGKNIAHKQKAFAEEISRRAKAISSTKSFI